MPHLTGPVSVCLIAFTCACACGWWWLRRRQKRTSQPNRFPPGPRGLPILGNLLAFRSAPLASLLCWKREYGPVVGLQLGAFRAVVISDYALLKEAFNNDAFNGRPAFRPFLLFTEGANHGTLTSAGEEWNAVRRFTIKQLNLLEFGKTSMEPVILKKIDRLCAELEPYATSGEPVYLRERFLMPVSCNVWYTLTGELLTYGGCRWREIQGALVRFDRDFWQPIGNPVWFLPSLTQWLPNWTGWTKVVESISELKRLVKETVQEHESISPSSGRASADLIGSFLTSSGETLLNGDHTESTILNLFISVAEGLGNLLSWAVLYLSLYPAVQTRLHAEIQTVDNASLSDLPDRLPYTKAVLQELLRIASTSPFSNFHSTTRDVDDFHGWRIPKDTVIIGNLYALHHDREIWGDPEVFRPERFLDFTGDTRIVSIPFSVGLRTCLGQAYAKNVLFLFLVRLVKKFEFSMPEGKEWNVEELTSACIVSIDRFCPQFKVVLKQRL